MKVGSTTRTTRGKGEGTIYLTKDGRWVASVSRSVGGVRKRSIKYCKTKREAQDALLILRQETVQKNRSTLTFGEWADEWLAEVQTTRRRSTAENYARLMQYAKTLFRYRLAMLSADDLRELYARLPVSPYTKYYLHGVVRVCLNDAWRRGYISENAAKRVSQPRPESAPVRSLTLEEAKAFLAAVKGDRYEALYVIALTCGLRMGELFGLRWYNVDLENRRLAVRQQVVCLSSGVIEVDVPLKTARARRDVALGALAYEPLKRLSEGSVDPGALVFANRTGGPLRRSNFINQTFHVLLDKANIPRFNFHKLRHTAATLWKMGGSDLYDVSVGLGHANTHVTDVIYVDLFHQTNPRAAEATDNLLR